jgi:hypothetical protein
MAATVKPHQRWMPGPSQAKSSAVGPFQSSVAVERMQDNGVRVDLVWLEVAT